MALSEFAKFAGKECRDMSLWNSAFASMFPSPDPDCIGKFFPIWTATAGIAESSACCNVAKDVDHCLRQLFGGGVIHCINRYIPDVREYGQVSVVPIAALAKQKEIPADKFRWSDLWIKLLPESREGCGPIMSFRPFMREKRRYEMDPTFNRYENSRHLVMKRYPNADYDEYVKQRSALYNHCFAWMFGEGSRLETVDDQEYLVTPFQFPPGYLRATARALVAEYGTSHKLVAEFMKLTTEALQHVAAQDTHPDYWWTKCKRPVWVFMLLFSRLMGEEQWAYTLAALEREFGDAIDWAGAL